MEELTYKDLSEKELDTLKDMYISSRVNEMTESDLRKFVKEIIIDQIKGTVGNAEEKEAWEEIKDHFSKNLTKKIHEVKEKCNKNPKVEAAKECTDTTGPPLLIKVPNRASIKVRETKIIFHSLKIPLLSSTINE